MGFLFLFSDFRADDLVAADYQRQRLSVLQIIMKETPAASGRSIRVAESFVNSIKDRIVREHSLGA